MSDPIDSLKFLGAVALFLTAGTGIYRCSTYKETDNVTIKDMTINPGKNSSGFLVMTDKGVFANKDDWFHGKFDAADMQNSLEIGKTYNMQHAGKRIPLFSAFPNIIVANEVEKKDTVKIKALTP